MGSATSKAARKLPREKPSWAGARASDVGTNAARPVASEVKNEAIDKDSRDPHFMSNLQRLGPVPVDHHMQTIRTADHFKHMYQTRAQSEAEASSSNSVQNRMLGSTLSDLLDARTAASSQKELDALADKYNIDMEKFTELSRYVNSPSIDEDTIVVSTDGDGEEVRSMTAIWRGPNFGDTRHR
ncbi:hypothetical protein SERLADRAFT_375029 [Serpula lacrymans var. lacrymans S7.9]|uniref:Uncharacterized protein n=1 Tax=Serpula lacrymans var. lacrymans (strain S7.9) TaxID=578457 RepID=F8PE24_SERL9|nr:uncharacterized protein SERLADRAFT_375029 [Serpula lacrymans var. lacrymans S7.9]EGO18621.1 hypothetical protein SERLADRAFT_375029 [Serpula lacrymans var. lacrymans S7.9]